MKIALNIDLNIETGTNNAVVLKFSIYLHLILKFLFKYNYFFYLFVTIFKSFGTHLDKVSLTTLVLFCSPK